MRMMILLVTAEAVSVATPLGAAEGVDAAGGRGRTEAPAEKSAARRVG